METQTTSDITAPQHDDQLSGGHKMSRQSTLEIDNRTVDKTTSSSSTEVSATPASTTQCTELPTVGENSQSKTGDPRKVISSDGSKPVAVSAPPAKVLLIHTKKSGVVKQRIENPSVKHIFVQEATGKGSTQVVARLVPAVIQTSKKDINAPIYVINLPGKQAKQHSVLQISKTEKQLKFNKEQSKMSHKDFSSQIPQFPGTFDDSCRSPGESCVPVIESVFSLQNRHPNILEAKKKVVILNPPSLKTGVRVYIGVPEAGSSRNQTSTLHEHTLYRMASVADFTRKYRNLKSIFQKMSVNRAIMSFRQLTEECYTLVKDQMKDLALLDRCEMLLTMRRFVDEFDRYCEMMHPALMIAMSVYLPDVKDYRMLTWHGIPPLGWRTYSITVIMREVFTIVLQLCCGGAEVPPLDSCYFTASSDYAGKLKLREAVFRVPKDEENSRNSTSVWGIKSGLVDRSTDRASSCETLKTHAYPAMPSASYRNTNGMQTSSTSPINTTDVSMTVQTPNMSSPGEMSSTASTAPAGTSADHMDTHTVRNKVTTSCNKPALNEMSPTARKDSQKHGCDVIRKSSNLEQIHSVPNVAETQTLSQPLISPVTGDSSKDTANLVTPKSLPAAGKDISSMRQDVKVAKNASNGVIRTQENETEKTSSEGVKRHPCVGKPDDPSVVDSPVQQPNASSSTERNPDHTVTGKLKRVAQSRFFHAMWCNLAPEECQLEIPDAGTCSLSKYLEEKPLESAAPPKGTVLLVDKERYDANQVLNEFRRGVVYGKNSKKTFTDEHFYQTYASVRVLPNMMPFQATQAGISRAAGMLHEDFSEQPMPGKGRPRRTLKGIWPLNHEQCGKRKTGAKRSAPTMKGGPTKDMVKTVPEKRQRSSENGNNFSTGTSCKVEPEDTPSTVNQDSNPTGSRQVTNGSANNEIFAQLLAALTGIPPRLDNHEGSEYAANMVTSLRQTADFLYQTAAEIEKRHDGNK